VALNSSVILLRNIGLDPLVGPVKAECWAPLEHRWISGDLL
jgi:hypothetical protein